MVSIEDRRPGLAAAISMLEAEVGPTYSAAVLLCGDRGDERLRCAAGQAGLSTWFDLASLTKALCTSVLAMRLYEAGRLSLEEEPLPGVSVAHLLGHASGLPAWLPLHSMIGPDQPTIQPATASDPAPTIARPASDPRAAIADIAAAAPRGPAGTRAVYSDLGFILLGRLIEERGGDRLDRLFAPVASSIGAAIGFRPLDVGRGGNPGPAVPASACAPTRRESPGREPLLGVVHDDNARAMGGVAGHAGLFGTAGGVSRMARALLCTGLGVGRPLGISARTVRRFWERGHVPGSTWGLGWDHPSPRDPADPLASSAGTLWSREGVGHLGFTGCSLWIDPAPEARRWVVFLSNRVDMPDPATAAEAQRRMKGLRPRLHDALCLALAGGGD